MVVTNIQTFSGDVEVTSNISITSNLTVGTNKLFVSESSDSVGISNTNPNAEYQLSIGSNIFANAYADMDNLSNAITVHGRIAANLFVGDGGLLSNIASNVSDIVNQGNTIANVVQFVQNDTYDAGIATEDGVVVGISNTAPSKEYQLSIGSNIFANAYADMDNLSNAITVHGRIAANLFVGDGGLLSNIASNVSDIVNQGNTIANVVQFVQNDTYDAGIVTEEGVVVGISNTAPSGTYELSVGSNLFINTTGSNVLTVYGNVNANTLTLGDLRVTASYGLNHVTAQNATTSDTVNFTNATTAFVTTANVEVGGEMTVSGNVEVGGEMTVSGNAEVGGEMTVSGNAEVSGEMTVSANVEVGGEMTVSANVEVGTANLFVDTT